MNARNWSSIRGWLLSRLQYAELRGVPIDSPETSVVRRELVQRNACARYSFERWYRQLAAAVATAPKGLRVELGSGGGFLDRYIPNLIKTEVVPLPFIDVVCRAESLPFASASTGAIVMVNVLHHIGEVDRFFDEATRILIPGGLIVMIEPFVSRWSRLVYRYLHHEPFDPEVEEWKLPPAGRLSGGNDALSWILFVRDRERFSRQYPKLRIEGVQPHSAFSHLLSGGVTTRPLAPLWMIRGLAGLEARHTRAMTRLGLFFTVEVRRTL
jgi:SAM-dependent methyltransferase